MDFLYLNQRIDRFLEKVSPVVAYDKYRARRFQLILVHSLAHLASINLNVSPVWTGKSVNAAAQIVHLLDNFDFRELRFLHPIMGVSGIYLIFLVVEPLMLRRTSGAYQATSLLRNTIGSREFPRIILPAKIWIS